MEKFLDLIAWAVLIALSAFTLGLCFAGMLGVSVPGRNPVAIAASIVLAINVAAGFIAINAEE